MKEKVTKKQAEKELNKYADEVSQGDVEKTVKDKSKIDKIFEHVKSLAKYKDEIALVFSMLKDYVKGDYKQVPWRTIAVLVGSLAYVVAPLDLIPDVIPIIGWSDDCLALAGALSFAKMDLEEYKAWKTVCKKGTRVPSCCAGEPVLL